MVKTLETIELQIEKLKAEKVALLNQNLESARKLRARQAHVLGEWMLTMDPIGAKGVMAQLTDPKHRRLFELDRGHSVDRPAFDRTPKFQQSSAEEIWGFVALTAPS